MGDPSELEILQREYDNTYNSLILARYSHRSGGKVSLMKVQHHESQFNVASMALADYKAKHRLKDLASADLPSEASVSFKALLENPSEALVEHTAKFLFLHNEQWDDNRIDSDSVRYWFGCTDPKTREDEAIKMTVDDLKADARAAIRGILAFFTKPQEVPHG